ncbi:tetraspanin 31 [Rhinolophus ferrumequinum]|uniref:Tetraspanin 31 n=1 Tax=Rhinolophus ferrumequinum TaxID=59479 RepID=A0A671FSA2_RHIFE|nr:tetraspanin 31 [Rhinolophus ferrumequinum]
MVCGGFACSKNALCALNVVYMLVGLLLIGVAAWGKGLDLVSSIHIIGGVIAVGVFLLLIAVAGLVCKNQIPPCQMCGEKFLKHSDEALKILGGVGLFFSFTEILGVWLAMRFRNQKDPRANPSAFL